MNDLEQRAAAALTRRADLAEPREDLQAITADVPVVGVLVDRRRGRAWLPLIAASAAALIVVLTIAVIADRGGDGGTQVPATSPVPLPDTALRWRMPHAELGAQGVAIEYKGQTFAPTNEATAVSSFESRDAEEVVISWQQHGAEVAWSIQLASNGTDWWVERTVVGVHVPTVDGSPSPPPLPSEVPPNFTLDSDAVRAPIGVTWTGDLDLSGPGEGGFPSSGAIRVTGLQLLGFRDRAVDLEEPVPTGSTLPPATLPPPPPLPADVPATGTNLSAAQHLLVRLAQDTLERECMADAGFEYDAWPEAELISTFGWGIAPLGVHRRSAQAHGYRLVDLMRYGAAYEDLSVDEQAAFLDGSRGCYVTTLGPMPDFAPGVYFPAYQVIGDLREQAKADPLVIQAFDDWGDCLEAKVGERAANPDELARSYADGDKARRDSAGDHEKAVAVADAECQAQVDLETIWNTALAARERLAMGDRVGEYDEWARQLQSVLTTAEQVLADRGIVPPSLD